VRRTALLLSFLLLLAACGSRVDTSATGGFTTTPGGSGGSGAGKTSAPAQDRNRIGTLKNPCSAKKPTGAAPTDTPGVSDTAIKIGVISDRKNDLTPVPTIGVEEAAQAFVDFCNDSGGINGRKLSLKKYDSGILNTDAVTKQACQAGLFALVGDGSVQDQQGVSTREGCGLPEIAAYAATSERSISKDFFSPVPGTQPDKFNAGPCRFMVDRFPGATKKAAMIYTDVPASKVRGQATMEACEKEGFDYVVEAGVAFGEKNFAPVVTEMKDKGARLLEVVSVVPDTLKILQEAKRQGLDLDVIDLGQQYYDSAMAQDPSADGAYVLTNTTPFSEMRSTPALQVYDRWMKGGPETSLGVQAFSAGLLFAQAASSLGNDLTQENLIAALTKIHEWDGGGLQLLADPGANAHNECYLYLQIKDKDFVRVFPKKGFSCAEDNVLTLSKKYLTS
jgi:ABC-type branched-subunit amino acid transport system substrate-binding protein